MAVNKNLGSGEGKFKLTGGKEVRGVGGWREKRLRIWSPDPLCWRCINWSAVQIIIVARSHIALTTCLLLL